MLKLPVLTRQKGPVFEMEQFLWSFSLPKSYTSSTFGALKFPLLWIFTVICLLAIWIFSFVDPKLWIQSDLCQTGCLRDCHPFHLGSWFLRIFGKNVQIHLYKHTHIYSKQQHPISCILADQFALQEHLGWHGVPSKYSSFAQNSAVWQFVHCLLS